MLKALKNTFKLWSYPNSLETITSGRQHMDEINQQYPSLDDKSKVGPSLPYSLVKVIARRHDNSPNYAISALIVDCAGNIEHKIPLRSSVPINEAISVLTKYDNIHEEQLLNGISNKEKRKIREGYIAPKRTKENVRNVNKKFLAN